MIRSANIRRSAALGLAISSILASGAASAALEEIVVTARKVEEKLQDVPISVAAFSSDKIEEMGSRDLYDIARFTPGFSFERWNRYGVQGGISRPVIRGQSNILGEGNASVFVDGILYSDSILAFPMDIVERVEVIKGPQAALFGRSTFSGAINMITKKGSDVPENKVSLRAAQYDDYEVNALSRGVLVDNKLFYMVHARYYTMDGMYRNTLDGEKVGAEESTNFNASVELRASDAFRAIMSGGYSKDEDGLAAITLQSRFANNCYLNVARQYYCGAVTVPDSVTLDRAGLSGTGGLDRESTRLSLQLIYDSDNFVITSNTGGFWTDSEYGYDSTYQGAMAFGLLTVPGAPGYTRAVTDPVRTGSVNRLELSERDEWSTELRIESSASSRVRWLAGLYYYDSSRTLSERHFLTTAPTIYSGESQVENWAVFGSVGMDFNDQWSATAELRYAEDKVGNFNETRSVALIEQKFKSTSPRFTLSYRPAPDHMVYANVAKGNKPGVINADPRFPPEIRFADEESAWTYELGSKNTLMDGRLILNADIYYIDWKNQQLTTTYTFPTGGTQSYIINAGKSRVQGLELETQMAVTDSVTAGLTYSYTDAEFKEFVDPEAGQLFGNTSLEGYKLPGVPQQQASLWGKYSFPVGDFNGYVRGDLAYTDRKYDQAYNLAYTGYQTLLNMSVGIDNDHWSASLWVHNLTDDDTPSSVTRYVDQLNLNVPQYVNSNPAQNNVPGSTTTERAFLFGMPAKRQYGVTLSYKF